MYYIHLYHISEGPGKTIFFIGEEDHQVPSTSKILLDSGLFVVVGRMVGHSVLHGGPGLNGLSTALFSTLIGQGEDGLVSIEDCPDMDVREMLEKVSCRREH